MQYRGGKNRFAKEILAHMPHCHPFIEPFVGGGGMTRHAVHCGKFKEFYCSDAKRMGIYLGKVDFKRSGLINTKKKSGASIHPQRRHRQKF